MAVRTMLASEKAPAKQIPSVATATGVPPCPSTDHLRMLGHSMHEKYMHELSLMAAP